MAPSEHHLVRGQGPGLVGEQKVDLAHFLHDLCRSCLGHFVTHRVVHLLVRVDLEGKDEFQHLIDHIQTHGHDVVERDAKHEEPDDRIPRVLDQLLVSRGQRALRGKGNDRGEEADAEEAHQETAHTIVQVHLHVGELHDRGRRIHPRLCVLAHIDGHREDEGRVAQDAATRQEVVLTEGAHQLCLFVPTGLQGASHVREHRRGGAELELHARALKAVDEAHHLLAQGQRGEEVALLRLRLHLLPFEGLVLRALAGHDLAEAGRLPHL
mmetsp:Transcript_33177/g.105569  ORF Transcript_33177/g.105569 Transcript_33177/m.105569 type:complete len:268 (-) Transcript_33177:991-1794(-)